MSIKFVVVNLDYDLPNKKTSVVYDRGLFIWS